MELHNTSLEYAFPYQSIEFHITKILKEIFCRKKVGIIGELPLGSFVDPSVLSILTARGGAKLPIHNVYCPQEQTHNLPGIQNT